MDEIIYAYTSREAEEDGVLFDISKIRESWKQGPFNYVTTNLLYCGYLKDDDSINIPSIMDLLNQALNILRKGSNNFMEVDTFYDGIIELPSGEEATIFITQNETGKFTLMLAEDY